MHFDPRLIDLTRSFARDVAGEDDALPESILVILLNLLEKKLTIYKPPRNTTDTPNVTRLLELRCASMISEYLSALERFHEGTATEHVVAHLGVKPDDPDFAAWCARPITERVFLRRFVRGVVGPTLKTDTLSTAMRVAVILYDVASGKIVDELTNHRLSESSKQAGENVQQLNTPAKRAREAVAERFPYLRVREATRNVDLRERLATWRAFGEFSTQALLMTGVLNRIAQLTACWLCRHQNVPTSRPLNHRFFDRPDGCGQLMHPDGTNTLSPFTPACGDDRSWSRLALNEARRHVLLCADCGGLPRLWDEYQDRQYRKGQSSSESRPQMTSPLSAHWLTSWRPDVVTPIVRRN